MHAALQLSEISEVVFEFLDRHTLACLARTCRAFEGPALDALWRVIPELYPLASLVPDSIFEEDPLETHRYQLLHPLSPQQWRVIRKYTSRISVITSCILWFYASHKLYTIAADSPPFPEPLFPKLRAIQGIFACKYDILTLFHWLNGPSMARLDAAISSNPPSEEMIDFVSWMPALYPNMKSLTLSANPSQYPVAEMVRSVSMAIRSWKHLVHADLCTIDLDTAAYEHLMYLESLTSLRLTFVDHSLPLPRQSIHLRNPFPALTDLTLCGCCAPSATEWLEPLHLRLQSLSCSIEDSSSEPSQFANLCRAVAAQLCHNSLERINLREDGGTTVVEADTIRPLFSFSHLHCVEIAFPCITSLSDDDVLELASSWPLLESLDLGGAIFRETGPLSIPTFKGFFHLLQKCPRLRSLVIFIDTRGLGSISIVRRLEGIRNHPMCYLSLGNSPINDAKQTASALWMALPYVKQVDLGCWDDYLLDELPGRDVLFPLWRRVNHYLGKFHEGRHWDRDGRVVPWRTV